ncbi:serine/threonine-protein kinase [Mycolicibacterium sp. 050158]|uniref:serine/threonine-protein kinase n=1 Tax=Mycolicibacterium sp. 050158 TaxID=3090602 RepID=UPI0039A4EEA6
MPFADGAKFAGYTIERQLGSGGMGEVYLVQHPRLPRHDALKILRSDISADADFVERFNREADLAAKLWHPHIVGIHDRGKYRGRLWISMDFVDGTDAAASMKEHHPHGMPQGEAVDIVRAVAAALDYAHARGLLHRDVKPANILLADVDLGDRRILLGDFGVARDMADEASGGLTATNMTVGTTAYAAPEQLMGLDLDGRTDQYALAATAYHLLTGAPPFAHTNPAVVISQHLNATPPPISKTRPDLTHLDSALSRALAKEPDRRFATCMDFARAFEEPATKPVPVLPPRMNDADTVLRVAAVPVAAASVGAAVPVTEQPMPVRRRPGRVTWAGGVVLAVVGIVAYVALRSPGVDSPKEPFTLAGTLRLSPDVVKTSGLPGGYKCAGARDYGDVGPSAPVTVADESGKLLAKGAINASRSGGDGCALTFRVDDVPAGAHFYRVKVAQHPEVSYTETEAKAGVDFLMGNPDPVSTTPTAEPVKPTPPTTVRTATPTPDVEAASLSRLRDIARNDRSDVANYLTDVWIPQISSKRVGLQAEGTQWDNVQILDEHLRLRQIYPAVKLLWSGDWSTYDGRDFWVTVVGLHADNPDDVLDWCTREGFDRDHCIAKVVSTWRPIAGSTKMNP